MEAGSSINELRVAFTVSARKEKMSSDSMASREGIPRGSSTWLTQTVLHFRSPRSGRERKRGTTSGESFRNRIATQRGSWKRGKRPVESERESRLRKRNCSAARRTLARNFPPGYRLPYPRWNRGPFERPVSSFFHSKTVPILNREILNQIERRNFYQTRLEIESPSN